MNHAEIIAEAERLIDDGRMEEARVLMRNEILKCSMGDASNIMRSMEFLRFVGTPRAAKLMIYASGVKP